MSLSISRLNIHQPRLERGFLLLGNILAARRFKLHHMEIPNLERANAVLIGGNWTVVSKAYPSDIDGWLTLETAQFVKVSVRTSSIEAVRYQDLPSIPQVPAHLTWGLD